MLSLKKEKNLNNAQSIKSKSILYITIFPDHMAKCHEYALNMKVAILFPTSGGRILDSGFIFFQTNQSITK
jgi:hypothetical protein